MSNHRIVKFNIPYSTLHDRANTLNLKSTFINKQLTRNKRYTEKDIIEALNYMKSGQTLSASSKKYNIPYSTLHDRLNKMGEGNESQETNPIVGLDEGDPEISFNLR